MATCLEDLAVVLQAIADSLAGGGEIPNISISLEANAQSNAISASSSQAISVSNAIALAEAYAIALSIVDIDLRVEQTQVVNLLLPPVSQSAPPVIVDYPSEETGITATPTDDKENATGEFCDAIVAVIRAIVVLVETLTLVPEGLWNVPSVVLSVWEMALKAAVFVNSLLPVPKAEMAAISAYLTAEHAAGTSIEEVLTEIADFLQFNEGDLAQQIFCSYGGDETTSYEMAKLFQEYMAGQQQLSLPAIAVISILFSPQAMAAMIYLPRWGVPSIGADCQGCQ